MKLAVIADDLTGATDAGVQFAKAGMTCRVVPAIEGASRYFADAEVVCLDIDSRSADPETARLLTVRACSELKKASHRTIYKKMDSTLRGNTGAEIDALLGALPFKWAAICPSNLESGRITAGGYLLVHGVPLSETEFARDPKRPVRNSYVPSVIGAMSAHAAGLVSLADVSGNKDTVLRALRQLRKDGCRLVVFDATTPDHFRRIAEASLEYEEDFFWCGSAGMSAVLPDVYGWKGGARHEYASGSAGSPVLMVIGSASAQTRAQIRFLIRETRIVAIRPDIRGILADRDAEAERCAAAVSEALMEGSDVIVSTALNGDAETREIAVNASESASFSPAVADSIPGALGLIAGAVHPKMFGSLVLSGGETAVNVCRGTGIEAIDMFGEIVTGVAFGRICGGPHEGAVVATKPGAFCREDALFEVLNFLKKNESEVRS